MKIDDETTDVLIGGYLSTEAAHEDYEAVLGCGARLWGAVVVSKDLEGNVSLEQTDHTVEEGAAGLAGVGLRRRACSHPRCSPRPRSARRSVPSAARRCTRRSAAVSRRWPETTIPIGGAGLIVAYPHSAAEKVEPAVTRAMQKVVGEAEGHHVKALRARSPTPRRRWPSGPAEAHESGASGEPSEEVRGRRRPGIRCVPAELYGLASEAGRDAVAPAVRDVAQVRAASLHAEGCRRSDHAGCSRCTARSTRGRASRRTTPRRCR